MKSREEEIKKREEALKEREAKAQDLKFKLSHSSGFYKSIENQKGFEKMITDDY
jgi:hypothetical protein